MAFLVGKRAPDSPPRQVAADRQQELIDAAGLRIASKARGELSRGRRPKRGFVVEFHTRFWGETTNWKKRGFIMKDLP